jgi:hypothetical protein
VLGALQRNFKTRDGVGDLLRRFTRNERILISAKKWQRRFAAARYWTIESMSLFSSSCRTDGSLRAASHGSVAIEA